MERQHIFFVASGDVKDYFYIMTESSVAQDLRAFERSDSI